MRSAGLFIPLVAGIVVLAACDDPNVPTRAAAYPFRAINQSTKDTLLFHWPLERLPVRYWAQDIGALRDFTAFAIETWESQFLYGEFRGEMVSDSNDADVIITFGGGPFPDLPADGSSPVESCFGVTRVPDASGPRTQRVFNDLIRVQVSGGIGFTPQDVVNCIRRVVLHELGHTLGLFQESTDSADVMFNDPPLSLEPTDRDRNTVQILYHTDPNVAPIPR